MQPHTNHSTSLSFAFLRCKVNLKTLQHEVNKGLSSPLARVHMVPGRHCSGKLVQPQEGKWISKPALQICLYSSTQPDRHSPGHLIIKMIKKLFASANTPRAQPRDHVVPFSVAQHGVLPASVRKARSGCSGSDYDGDKRCRKSVDGNVQAGCWLILSGRYSQNIPPLPLG